MRISRLKMLARLYTAKIVSSEAENARKKNVDPERYKLAYAGFGLERNRTTTVITERESGK